MSSVDGLIEIARKISTTLTREQIKHSLCGGVAFNLRGAKKNTLDVDFYIEEEDYPKLLAWADNCPWFTPLNMVRGEGDVIYKVGLWYESKTQVDFINTFHTTLQFGRKFNLDNVSLINDIPVLTPKMLVFSKVLPDPAREKDARDLLIFVRAFDLQEDYIAEDNLPQRMVDVYNSVVRSK